MRPPEEVLLKYVLPNVRGLLAHALRARGYSQSRISSILGVSQAAVSGYLSKNITAYLEELRSIGIPDEEVNLLLNSLVGASSEGAPRLTQIIQVAWRRMLSMGYLCKIHRRLYPELSECEVCLSMDAKLPSERENLLEELKRAAEKLERSPELLTLYPEVSINIAYAPRDASNLNDVAAFPGRLVRVGARIIPVSKPAFGASRHLASILLGSIRLGESYRCVMNLKMVKGVEEAVRKAGLKAVSTSIKNKIRSDDDVVFDVIEVLKKNLDAQVVVDEGGIGLEPTVYVFGRNPLEVVERAINIARQLDKLRSL